MRNKKRPVLFLLAAVSCLSVMAMPAAAMDLPEEPNDSVIVQRAEETEWIYRKKADGTYEKRLWSITYGYWKTEWIDCVV